ncbi:MAG: YgiQ family radical SAM protein [Erysipelotrichaceae bacterium]|nr:YgiQ family radical SAM protein [Erysipelotrichaceae bacterium]
MEEEKAITEKDFLPVTREQMLERGWQQPDFVYITGDAYVDHPSFGLAIISRTLEAFNYKVCMVPQPDWHNDEDFKRFPAPRLAFLVTAGNIDSMVNHYSVNKRRRRKDYYSDDGVMGKRPDRATIVYCQILRRLYPDVPIVIGGIEASLRRLGHYDYWDDKVRNSILIDSQADLLLYGMGERSIVAMADALDSGLDIKDVTYIRGSCYKCKDITYLNDYIMLPSFEEIKNDKRKYAESFHVQGQNTDAITAKKLVEQYPGWYVVQNEPDYPLTTQEMDDTYALPYVRTFHPMYHYIPAIEEVKFSIISNRGCFGSCSFCALTNHQGRTISSRSKESIVSEAKLISQSKDFKGYINDIGGPTANFYHPSCRKQIEHGTCSFRECLFPKPCGNLEISHTDYLEILREVRKLPNVKKVFIRSGIRYDYLIYDKDDTFFRELVQYHISGQLKVAPEHVSPSVLKLMGKPSKEVYQRFVDKFEALNKQYHLNQYLVPYLISSHPGSTMETAVELAEYLKSVHHVPEQVQDFYPTPASKSTCMYYTGLDPDTMQEVYVERDPRKKRMQRALMQYSYPENYQLVYDALVMAKRTDLIGNSPKCLIRPRRNNSGRRKG